MIVRALATGWSLGAIAVDLWRGLSAGKLRMPKELLTGPSYWRSRAEHLENALIDVEHERDDYKAAWEDAKGDLEVEAAPKGGTPEPDDPPCAKCGQPVTDERFAVQSYETGAWTHDPCPPVCTPSTYPTGAMERMSRRGDIEAGAAITPAAAAPLGAGPERYVTGAELERVHDAAEVLRDAASSYAEAVSTSDPLSSEDGRWLAAADKRLLSAARAWVALLPAAPSAPQAETPDTEERRDANHERREEADSPGSEGGRRLLPADAGQVEQQGGQALAGGRAQTDAGHRDERRGDVVGRGRLTTSAPQGGPDPRDAEIERLRAALHRDQTGLAAAMNKIRTVAIGYSWIGRGEWGSYEWDQRTVETLQREVDTCLEEITTRIDDALLASGTLAQQTLVPPDGERPEPTAAQRLDEHRAAQPERVLGWWRRVAMDACLAALDRGDLTEGQASVMLGIDRVQVRWESDRRRNEALAEPYVPKVGARVEFTACGDVEEIGEDENEGDVLVAIDYEKPGLWIPISDVRPTSDEPLGAQLLRETAAEMEPGELET